MMNNSQRIASYRGQNEKSSLTSRQYRRVMHKMNRELQRKRTTMAAALSQNTIPAGTLKVGDHIRIRSSGTL